jgi:hypothetical protein
MIMALCGRRVDAEDAPVRRFPPENEEQVRNGIASLLDRYQPRVLVASAAAGADLLGLEEAGTRGVRLRVLLPFVPERFRATSVVDRPGDWGQRFDQMRALVEPAGDLVVHPASDVDEAEDAAYLRVVRAILDEALRLAQEELTVAGLNSPPNTRAVAVAVWDGTPRDAGDLTAAFIAEAHVRSIAVEHVATR